MLSNDYHERPFLGAIFRDHLKKTLALKSR